MPWARGSEGAPSLRAAARHMVTTKLQENFQFFPFFRPAAAAGRRLAHLQRKKESQVGVGSHLRLPQVEKAE